MRKSLSLMLFAIIPLIGNAAPTKIHEFKGHDYFNVRTIYNYTTQTMNYFSDNSYTELIPENTLYTYYDYLDNEVRQSGSYTVHYYDGDFNELTPFTFSFPKIHGYEIYDFSINSCSKYLFNDDDNWEFLLKYEMTDEYEDSIKYARIDNNDYSYRNLYQKIIVVDSKGQILYDFGTGASMYLQTMLHIFNGQYRLSLERNIYEAGANSATRVYEIWKLDKQQAEGLHVVEKLRSPYPNPATNEINLPVSDVNGMIRVYDVEGKKMESVQLYGQELYKLNISNYPAGLYIYENGGKQNSFIVR